MSEQPQTAGSGVSSVRPEEQMSDVQEPNVGPPIERGQRKIRQGIVVSDKMDKTVVVEIEQAKKHATYHKIVRRSRKLVAHDEAGDAHVGDTVRLMETRPLSKTKRWRVIEIVERAK